MVGFVSGPTPALRWHCDLALREMPTCVPQENNVLFPHNKSFINLASSATSFPGPWKRPWERGCLFGSRRFDPCRIDLAFKDVRAKIF